MTDSLNWITRLEDALDTICFQVKHGFVSNKDECIADARKLLAELTTAMGDASTRKDEGSQDASSGSLPTSSAYNPTPDNPCGHAPLRIHDVCLRCGMLGAVEYLDKQQLTSVCACPQGDTSEISVIELPEYEGWKTDLLRPLMDSPENSAIIKAAADLVSVFNQSIGSMGIVVAHERREAMKAMQDVMKPYLKRESVEAEQFHCDLKIAFPIEDDEPLWKVPADKWPAGYELIETDGSGCRYVAIFQCGHLPTEKETKAIRDVINSIEGQKP